MTGKERILKTIQFQEPDRPPHFEAMFELEREAFGLQFPHRDSWATMSSPEKERAIQSCMDIYERIIETYEWDALSVYWPWGDPDGVRAAKRRFGDEILVGGFVGSGVWSIEHIDDWDRFALDAMEHPEAMHAGAETMCQNAIEKIEELIDAGADFIYMPNDIAFNAGPYISPTQMDEYIFPYWRRQVDRVKELGAIAFIHTDGEIMPILDSIVSLEAHVLQSIDPMAGVDIAEVKRKTYGKLALMGNVQCNLLQEGPDEAIKTSALYCLNHGAPGGGYIYGTSNTIFPGMPLKNYHLMLSVFREWANARPGGAQA